MSKKTETTNYNIQQIDNGYIVRMSTWESARWVDDYSEAKVYCKDWAEVVTWMINNPFVRATK